VKLRLLALCGMTGDFLLDDGRRAREVKPGAVFIEVAEEAAHLIARRRACAAPDPVKEPKRKGAKKEA